MMRLSITAYLNFLLVIALSVGVVLSSYSRISAHHGAELAAVFAEHHTDTEEHGHAHDDLVRIIDAYHGHSHGVVDHDHNIGFLPPRKPAGILPTTRTSWRIAHHTKPDRKRFDLDRPPRV